MLYLIRLTLTKAKAAVAIQNALEAAQRTHLFDSVFTDTTPAFLANRMVEAYCKVNSDFLRTAYLTIGLPGKLPLAAATIALTIRKLDPGLNEQISGLQFALFEILKKCGPGGSASKSIDLDLILDALEVADGKGA